MTAAVAAALAGCGDDAARGDAATTPAAAATASAVPNTTGTSPVPTPNAPRCEADGLEATIAFPRGGGVAGGTVGSLRLRNASQAPCSLTGYPGVSLIDASGAQLGASARRDGTTIRTVTLRPGRSAIARIKLADPGVYGEACDLATATGWRIYPPGSRASLVVSRGLPACRSPRAPMVTIGPVTTR